MGRKRVGGFSMSERVDVHLGRRLRWRRRALGLTQQDVGEALGIRFQQVQKYESAANRMSAAVLWKLSAVLQVDVRYFFDGLSDRAPLDAERVADGLEPELQSL
ncbi:MAG: helix-turn-helix domain-containing protein [Phenylobacterium sp.]